jgi:hypothetical protein
MPERDRWSDRIAVIDRVMLKLAADGAVYGAGDWERIDEFGLRCGTTGPPPTGTSATSTMRRQRCSCTGAAARRRVPARSEELRQ